MRSQFFSRRVTLVLLATSLLAFLTSCQTEFSTEITFREDGSGEIAFEVIFDSASAQEIQSATFQSLTSFIDSADLNSASGGWEIQQALNSEISNSKLTAKKAFFNEQQIQAIFDEISPQAFSVSAKRTDRNGQRNLTIEGSLDVAKFRDNLFRENPRLQNIAKEGLPAEAAIVKITTTLVKGRETSTESESRNRNDDVESKAWQVSLFGDNFSDNFGDNPNSDPSNDRLDFKHSLNLNESSNDLWLWISISAFALFALALGINLLGWAYKKRHSSPFAKNKIIARPKKFPQKA